MEFRINLALSSSLQMRRRFVTNYLYDLFSPFDLREPSFKRIESENGTWILRFRHNQHMRLSRPRFVSTMRLFLSRSNSPPENQQFYFYPTDRSMHQCSFLPFSRSTGLYIRGEQSWLIVENRTVFDWPFKQENRIYYKSELKSWSIAAHGCVELRKRVSVSSSFNWRTLNGNGVVSAFTERRVTSGYVIQISFDRINTQDRSGGGGGGGIANELSSPRATGATRLASLTSSPPRVRFSLPPLDNRRDREIQFSRSRFPSSPPNRRFLAARNTLTPSRPSLSLVYNFRKNEFPLRSISQMFTQQRDPLERARSFFLRIFDS